MERDSDRLRGSRETLQSLVWERGDGSERLTWVLCSSWVGQGGRGGGEAGAGKKRKTEREVSIQSLEITVPICQYRCMLVKTRRRPGKDAEAGFHAGPLRRKIIHTTDEGGNRLSKFR